MAAEALQHYPSEVELKPVLTETEILLKHDPRLARAINAAAAFFSENTFPPIESFEQRAVYYNDLQKHVAEVLGIPDTKLREITQVGVELLDSTAVLPGGLAIIFRHGEQKHDEPAREFDDGVSPEARKKIRMMQQPFNKDDLLTDKSIAETIGTAAAIQDALSRAGRTVEEIESSSNARALSVAWLMSRMLSVPVKPVRALDCIDYPSDLPDVQIQEQLRSTKGAIGWDRDDVDRITTPGKAVTHTQQRNAVETFTGLPTDRSAELSILLVGGEFTVSDNKSGSVYIIDLRNGIYDTYEQKAA